MSKHQDSRASRAPRVGQALLLLVLAIAGCSGPTEGARVATLTTDTPSITLYMGPSGGQSLQLVVTPRDKAGNAIEGKQITWQSQSFLVATVSESGLVTAIGTGVTNIRATIGDVELLVPVTVAPVPVASVAIPYDTVALESSPIAIGSLQLTAALLDSVGAGIAGRPVAWATSAPAIATVTTEGLVRGVGSGAAIVRASAEGKSDSVVVLVSVTAGLPAGFDIAIAEVSWTQGAQNTSGSIPMLSGGRAAVVNVALSSPSDLGVPDEVELRLTAAGGGVLWADTNNVDVTAGTASMTDPTTQFLVPAGLLSVSTQWQVRRDPRGVLADANAATDRYPAGGATAINVITPPTLKLRFVPITLNAHGVSADVTAGNVDGYLEHLRSVAPVGAIETSVAPAMAVDGTFGTGDGAFWIPVLSQLDQARVASATYADWYWIGVVRPPGGVTFVANGGYGYIPNSGGYFGPGSRTSVLVELGWANQWDWERRIVTHELGHNFGRFHAPCGGAGNPDPSYPVSGGLIGDGGHDTWSWEQGLATRARAVSPSTGDVMGYCSPVWYGTYNYDNIVNFRGAATVALMAQLPRQRVLYVGGETDGRTVTLSRPRTMVAVPSQSDPDGGWILEGRDASGAVVLRFAFALARWDHEVERRPIALAVPLDDATADRLVSLSVIGPAGVTASRAIGSPDF